jgi:hypothetical protein
MMTEAQLQKLCVDALQVAGYTVLISNAGRKTGSTGVFQSKGIPDLLVGAPGWRMLAGIEFKTARGRVSPEQQALVDLGVVSIARSPSDVYHVIWQKEDAPSGIGHLKPPTVRRLLILKALLDP